MTVDHELAALLEDVAHRVDQWTGAECWSWQAGSPAAREVANHECRLDGAPWGDRPVRSAYQCAQMATKMTVEMARCAALLIAAGRRAPGVETLTRGSLEAASVAWWLLEPGLSGRA